ncbi:hypothetical protein [Streptomyces sp. NPDC005336]|uniref:hypothetical protein n=1 Tax=Streptomyces sp. NPDC005336 TaxID=3157035 RepID=UPI0033A2491E
MTLPEEYRTSLLEVGASGAGPDYGLLPSRLPYPDAPPSDGHLQRPFRPGPLMDLLTEHGEAEPVREDYADEDALQRDYRAWEERNEELDHELTDGTWLLSHQGCAYYTLLAVTGPERGTLWNDVRAVGEGIDPVRLRDKDRVSFAEWYLTWLAYAEREAWDEAPR